MTTVITTSATVLCGHGGQVGVANPAPVALVVGGNPVAVLAGVSTWTIPPVAAKPTGCPAVDPSGDPSPCLTITPPSGSPPTLGPARKLTVGGSPVLLQSLSAITLGSLAPAPPPPVYSTVSAVTSSKLSAV